MKRYTPADKALFKRLIREGLTLKDVIFPFYDKKITQNKVQSQPMRSHAKTSKKHT